MTIKEVKTKALSWYRKNGNDCEYSVWLVINMALSYQGFKQPKGFRVDNRIMVDIFEDE